MRAFATMLACAVFAVAAHAAPTRIEASVAWTRGAHVYIATRDSAALALGDVITLTEHHRAMARGEVSQVFADGLAMATLSWGSLDRVKHPDRLSVTVDRPAPARIPRWRVGMVSRGRSCLWFDCGAIALNEPHVEPPYRTQMLSEHLARMVRDSTSVAPPLWPDTLLIREFDDAGDEEIALERGELDIALFWPGELSSHMRDQPRWQPARLGALSRGIVAAIWPPGSDSALAHAASDPAWLALNESLFRGDLAPWNAAAFPADRDSMTHRVPPAALRFAVEPACPGRTAIERFLNHDSGANAAAVEARDVRVFYLDAAVTDTDSLASEFADYVRRGPFPAGLRLRAERLRAAMAVAEHAPTLTREQLTRVLADSLNVVPLFTLRTPVLCAPAFQRAVDGLGADAFGGLWECIEAARRP